MPSSRASGRSQREQAIGQISRAAEPDDGGCSPRWRDDQSTSAAVVIYPQAEPERSLGSGPSSWVISRSGWLSRSRCSLLGRATLREHRGQRVVARDELRTRSQLISFRRVGSSRIVGILMRRGKLMSGMLTKRDFRRAYTFTWAGRLLGRPRPSNPGVISPDSWIFSNASPRSRRPVSQHGV